MITSTSSPIKPSDMSLNRTGIGMSPLQSTEMIEGTHNPKLSAPSSEGNELAIEQVRCDYASHSESLGSVPPPSSLKGVAKVAIEMLKGRRPTILLDKLGERLAFERTGSRLYEALLAKYDASGSWEGGPGRADLTSIFDDELRHFKLLVDVVESLGADPTAITPSADLVAVESQGLLQVLADPRTSLLQGLHAILVAELTDRDGWQGLTDLARTLGHQELVDRFQAVQQREELHLIAVRGWVAQATEQLAQRDEQPAS